MCPSSRLTLASLAHIWVSKQDGNEPQTRMECARVTIVFSLMHKVPIPPTKCRNPKTEHRIEIFFFLFFCEVILAIRHKFYTTHNFCKIVKYYKIQYLQNFIRGSQKASVLELTAPFCGVSDSIVHCVKVTPCLLYHVSIVVSVECPYVTNSLSPGSVFPVLP